MNAVRPESLRGIATEKHARETKSCRATNGKKPKAGS